MQPRRHSIKTRLAISYALVAALTGLCVLATVYVVLVIAPSYALGEFNSIGPLDDSERVDQINMGGPTPAYDFGPIAGIVLSSRADVAKLLIVVGSIVVVVLAIVGAIVGSRLAEQMLNPLRAVRIAAQQVATGSLEHRIGLSGPADEVQALADTFDAMMAELERSFTITQRFAANASHELRTPLAASRALIDVSLRVKGVDDAMLSKLRTLNERSIETVETLLDLAEIESATKSNECFDLAPITAQVMADLKPEADEAQLVVISALEEVTVLGDPALVRTLLSNLIHNGIRHNQLGGSLQMRTFQGPAGPVFEVENDGVPVTAEALSRFEEPFWTARGRTAKGKSRGLGLSIANAIALRHNTKLVLTARPAGGLKAQVIFHGPKTRA